MRHLIGLEYEAVLEQRLRDLGAPHTTEGDARLTLTLTLAPTLALREP